MGSSCTGDYGIDRRVKTSALMCVQVTDVYFSVLYPTTKYSAKSAPYSYKHICAPYTECVC